MKVFDADKGDVKGDWDHNTDPMEAYLELLEQGHDPDGKYSVVGKAEDGQPEVVFEGNLLTSLEKAAELSKNGYFFVMPAGDVDSLIQELGVN